MVILLWLSLFDNGLTLLNIAVGFLSSILLFLLNDDVHGFVLRPFHTLKNVCTATKEKCLHLIQTVHQSDRNFESPTDSHEDPSLFSSHEHALQSNLHSHAHSHTAPLNLQSYISYSTSKANGIGIVGDKMNKISCDINTANGKGEYPVADCSDQHNSSNNNDANNLIPTSPSIVSKRSANSSSSQDETIQLALFSPPSDTVTIEVDVKITMKKIVELYKEQRSKFRSTTTSKDIPKPDSRATPISTPSQSLSQSSDIFIDSPLFLRYMGRELPMNSSPWSLGLTNMSTLEVEVDEHALFAQERERVDNQLSTLERELAIEQKAHLDGLRDIREFDVKGEEYEARIAQFNDTIALIQAEKTKLHEELERIQKEIQIQVNSRVKFEDCVNGSGDRERILREERTALEAKWNSLSSSLNELRAALTNARSAHARIQRERGTSRDQLHQATTRVEMMEKEKLEWKAKALRVTQLNEKSDKLERALSEISASQLTSRLQASEQALQDLQAEIAQLQSKCSDREEIEADLLSLKSRLKAGEKESRELLRNKTMCKALDKEAKEIDQLKQLVTQAKIRDHVQEKEIQELSAWRNCALLMQEEVLLLRNFKYQMTAAAQQVNGTKPSSDTLGTQTNDYIRSFDYDSMINDNDISDNSLIGSPSNPQSSSYLHNSIAFPSDNSLHLSTPFSSASFVPWQSSAARLRIIDDDNNNAIPSDSSRIIR